MATARSVPWPTCCLRGSCRTRQRICGSLGCSRRQIRAHGNAQTALLSARSARSAFVKRQSSLPRQPS
eukprot:4262648-Lingulodinium_polyedra.AAC.1